VPGIADPFPLITVEEDGTARLAFNHQMEGTLRLRDKMYRLSDLKDQKFVERGEEYSSVSLRGEDFAKLSVGPLHFFILYVPPAPRVKTPSLWEGDREL